jgi:hypothetical protein
MTTHSLNRENAATASTEDQIQQNHTATMIAAG